MKLYYTDPRIASLMLDWHGVKIEMRIFDNAMAKETRYYIHPGSVALFEPREGDEVRIGDWIYWATDEEHGREFQTVPPSALEGDEKIIQRDGKAFFMPESEV